MIVLRVGTDDEVIVQRVLGYFDWVVSEVVSK